MSPGLVMALVVGLALVGFVLLVRRATRPHTLVRLTDRRATLERGALPPGLLTDLCDVARSTGADGTVGLRGQQDTLQITTSGLEENVDQRVRNVVLLRRSRIRRP